MLTDNEISQIADEVIAKGVYVTSHAWYYLGAKYAHSLICDAIRKALQRDVRLARFYAEVSEPSSQEENN